ncbi:MAG: hypothetical protein ACT4RN_11915, partial [Pseudonocardia sp.]
GAARGDAGVVGARGRGRRALGAGPAVSGGAGQAGPAVDLGTAQAGTAPAGPAGGRRQVALVALAAVLVLAALWTADASERAVVHPGFTQLWLLPAAGPAPGSAPGAARLGVHSAETGTRVFRLDLRRDGALVDSWRITIAPGQTWEVPVAVGFGEQVEAVLHADGDPAPYRRVSVQP